MDLVVDHQPPVGGLKDLEVLEGAGLALPVGEDLVGGDGDGLDLLHVAHVEAHLVLGEAGLVQQFLLPLLHGGAIGGEHQGVGLQAAHAADADDGLARTAGQHQHTCAAFGAAARMEDVHGRLLVGAQAEGPPALL